MLLIQMLLDRAPTQWHGFGAAADAAQVWGKRQLAQMPLTTMNGQLAQCKSTKKSMDRRIESDKA
ncbi:hypothetical protein CVT25_014693 [Psilocybe cyanescens]|uniref:Uncharacterized protein n=1 Tax=Psilocybe cyanescens TaxID=93625 RepID=A0A409XBJ0_PSICY|nr:hypothetical protein CVT25_014693 [Psilocybe cyanescens]